MNKLKEQSPTIIFYTTSACHLCDLADSLLYILQQSYPIKVKVVDVALNDSLVKQYGTKIPVIVFPEVFFEAKSVELHWPFSLLDIKAVLER